MPTGLDVMDSSVMAAFCDYDRDGYLDLFITTNVLDITEHPNGQRGLPLPQQPRRHLHGCDRKRRDRGRVAEPFGDLVGLSTTTAGPISTSPTTTA